MMGLMLCVQPSVAQTKQPKDSTELVMNDTVAADSAMALIDADLEGEQAVEIEVYRRLGRLYVVGGIGTGHRFGILY